MSEEGSRGNLWGSHSWDFSNSENLMEKPVPNSSSNSPPSATPTEVGHEKRISRKGVSDDGKASTGGGSVGESDHDIHTWTERERRKKMRNMFSTLHALLPQLPPKADKSTIVDEAVNYIKTLQHTLQTLKKQRLEKLTTSNTLIDLDPSTITSRTQEIFDNESTREAFLADHQGPSKYSLMALNMTRSHDSTCFQTWFSPNVVINTCGNEAQISVCSMRKTGLLATILFILDKHKLEVVSAQISSNHYRSIYMIHVHAAGASDQLPEAISVEETFKLAVGEMILWVSSC